MHMFCYQCQETGEGKGCTHTGECGKSEEAANLQDLVIYALKGIGILNDALVNTGGAIDRKIGMFVCHALFTTVTNTNFDPDRLHGVIARALAIKREIRARHAEMRERAWGLLRDPGRRPCREDEYVVWDSTDRAEIVQKAYEVGVLATPNEDMRSLREMITYALKGMAAYTYHANILGYFDDSILAFIYRALTAVSREHTLGELVALSLEAGKVTIDAMALLDTANNETFGQSTVSKVPLGVRNNPGYPDLRPRPQGHRGFAQANRRHGRRRLHPLGNDRRALLPEAQTLLPPGRKLRERVVEPGRGFCHIQRTDHRHLELHHAGATGICRPHLHDRPCGLSGRPPYPARRARADRFRRGHRAREALAAPAANRRSDVHRRLRLAPARGGRATHRRPRESRGRSSASSSSQAATGATGRASTIARSPNACRSIRSSSRPGAPSTRS